MSKDDRSQQTSRRTWPSWPSLHAGNLQKEATGCSDSAHRWQSVDVHRSFAAGQRRMMPWQHESVLDGCVLFSLLPYPYLNSQLSRHHHHQLAVAITRQRKVPVATFVCCAYILFSDPCDLGSHNGTSELLSLLKAQTIVLMLSHHNLCTLLLPVMEIWRHRKSTGH